MNRTERVQTATQYMGVLRRRWPYLVTILPAAVLLAVLMAFTLPAIYQSSATILLEASSIDPTLVKTSVVSYADQQIELVRRTVMTADNVEPIVKKVDPYPDLKDVSTREKANMILGDFNIQKVDPVTLEPMVLSNAFSIYYNNPSPQIAAEVTGLIAELFLESGRASRTAQARDAYNFLLVASKTAEQQMLELEKRISEFKSKYGDALPDAMARNETSLDRTQREYDAGMAQIRVVEQQESLLKLQLSQISPTLIAEKGGDIYTQLGTLRAQLAEAQQKYTPDHPDVKRLTRAIQTLAEQSKLGNPQNIKPDNPEYMRVSSELNAVRGELAALRSNTARARAQILDYERRLSSTPGVEREFVQLTREREILQQQFGEIQSKLRNAQMSENLEAEAKGERYTLIRKASVPFKPDSPNRLGIIMLGVVLGGALSVGMAAFRESTDPTVRATYDVYDVSSLPLIGAIPSIANPADRRRKKLIWTSLAGTYAVAIVGVAVAVLAS